MDRDHTVKGVGFIAICVAIAIIIYFVLKPAPEKTDTVNGEAEIGELQGHAGEFQVNIDEAPTFEESPSTDQGASDEMGQRQSEEAAPSEGQASEETEKNADPSKGRQGDEPLQTTSIIPPPPPISPPEPDQ